MLTRIIPKRFGTDEDGWIAVRKNDDRGKVPKSYLQPHGIMNV